MKNAKRVLSQILAVSLVLAFMGGCAIKQQEPLSASVMDDATIISHLAGKVWVAEYIHGKPVIDMSHTSMVFAENGTVKGRGGCNSFSGTYELKDGTISFGHMAATMKLCPEAINDQEFRFFQSLKDKHAVSFRDGLLILTPDSGSPSSFAVHNTD